MWTSSRSKHLRDTHSLRLPSGMTAAPKPLDEKPWQDLRPQPSPGAIRSRRLRSFSESTWFEIDGDLPEGWRSWLIDLMTEALLLRRASEPSGLPKTFHARRSVVTQVTKTRSSASYLRGFGKRKSGSGELGNPTP